MKSYNLSSIIDIIGGGTPKRNASEYWDGDIPWISVVDFNSDSRFVSDTKETITEAGLIKSSTKLLNAGDLIISARGTVGCLGQLTSPMAFNQSCYGLRGKAGIISNDYLYYLLKHKVKELQSKGHGSVFNTITRETFDKITVAIPDIASQKKISFILGSLDEKILINTQMNQTLEKIAQRIFKSWFIDFDPVKANAEGVSFDGLSPEMQKLFPSEFEESELGAIPKGWTYDKIGNIVDRCKVGKRYSRKETRSTGSVPVIDQGKEGVIGYHNGKPDVLASPEDPVITFANHTCKMDLHWYKFSAIQNVLPFRSRKAATLWLFFATIGKQEHTEYKGHWPEFEFHSIVLPPKELTEVFDLQVGSLIRRVWNNRDEIETLSKIRDKLLPRLLSGKLEISNFSDITNNKEAL